jgi:predicted flap endonuclease-1-like 5' DNA nuclease
MTSAKAASELAATALEGQLAEAIEAQTASEALATTRQDEVVRLQRQLETSEDERHQVERDGREQRASLEEARGRIAVLVQGRETLQTRVSGLQQDAAEAAARLVVVERERDDAMRRIEQLEDAQADVQRIADRVPELEASLSERSRSLSEARRAATRAATLQRDLDRLEQELMVIESERDAALVRVVELNSRLRRADRVGDRDASELREELVRWKERALSLEEQHRDDQLRLVELLGRAGELRRPGMLLASPEGAVDDLTRIDGIDERLQQQLYSLGVFHFRQLAELRIEDIAWIAMRTQHGAAQIFGDRWVEQAAELEAWRD